MRPSWIIVIAFLPLFLSAQEQQFSEADFTINSQTALESKFNLFEIDQYEDDAVDNAVFLENGYAQFAISNPQKWTRKMTNFRATEINLIYTKYPKNKELWRTNYRGLMMNRLKELFRIDSSLNSSEIEWNIVLQTACNTEPEAMRMLHGIEIYFEPIELSDTTITTEVDSVPPAVKPNFASQESKLDRMIKRSGGPTSNLTAVNVLERHPEWKNSLVVMDWTGSMYGFGSKAMRWHLKNFEKSGITNVVLFTDGDSFKKGKLGNFGGIIYSSASDPKKLVKLMRKNMRGHYNRETEENNIEGLLKGIAQFPDYDELIMIADNRSCMKDYCICDLLNVPVRIILCGTEYGVNPQYVNLAYKLGGSVHTLENDILGFEAYKVQGTELVIESSVFVYNPKTDRFEEKIKTSKRNLGYQDCGEFYKLKSKCKKFIANYAGQ